MSESAGRVEWRLTFEISPVILTGGIAQDMAGGMLPIERAACEAVRSWRELYNRCRSRMAAHAPLDAEQEAIEAHEAAAADLRAMASPFSIIAERCRVRDREILPRNSGLMF